MMRRRKVWESLAAICLLLLLAAKWRREWAYVYAAGGVLLSGLLWPRGAAWLAAGWLKLGKAIGAVTGRVLLVLIFVLVVLPVSFFARRKDRLAIKLKPRAGSHFKDRDHTYLPADLKNPW